MHQNTFFTKEEGPCVLTLAGRAWQTTYSDWRRRIAYVAPTNSGGHSQWFSAGRAMPSVLCQSIPAILAGTAKPQGLAGRALELLEDLREPYVWESKDCTSLIDNGDGYFWWSFADKHANAALANRLQRGIEDVKFDNFYLQFSNEITLKQLQKMISELSLLPPQEFLVPLDENFVVELKCFLSVSRKRVWMKCYVPSKKLQML